MSYARGMTILSWNLYFLNPELEDAFAFIRDQDADIICLQEVPAAFLELLQALPLSVTSAIETAMTRNGERLENHSVVLSRYPLAAAHEVLLPNRDRQMPLRGRLFIGFMYLTGLWKRTRNLGFPRGVAIADVETPEHGTVRVASAHLSLTNPRWRAEELGIVLDAMGTGFPRIVAGDFNIIESFPVSVINWLLGGTLADAFQAKRERASLVRLLARRGLANPFARLRTHRVSGSQLDHILVSESLRTRDPRVLPDCHGSDHNPIRLSVA